MPKDFGYTKLFHEKFAFNFKKEKFSSESVTKREHSRIYNRFIQNN